MHLELTTDGADDTDRTLLGMAMDMVGFTGPVNSPPWKCLFASVPSAKSVVSNAAFRVVSFEAYHLID